MKKVAIFFFVLFFSFSTCFLSFRNNGGDTCMECTLVASILENYAKNHPGNFDTLLTDFCQLLPVELRPICFYFVDMYGQIVLDLLLNEANPDEVCWAIELCKNPACHLYQKTGKQFPVIKGLKSVKEWPWDWLIDRINYVIKQHLPFEDIDGDYYSVMDSLRGKSWRGGDCDDTNPDIHAGRVPTYEHRFVDNNCNGISGMAQINQTYEDLFCNGTEPRGVVILGGSACSHFEIEPKWLNPINESTYEDLLFAIENEMDWPHRSWSTGYEQSTPETPVDSVYLRLRARNRCNHRDFQNTGVNGFSSRNIHENIKTLKRDKNLDYPLLVIHNPLGDDICNMNTEDPLSRMTTPQEFLENVLGTLTYLDQMIPENSHVLFIGIVDARVLWDHLHNVSHPLGPSYEQVYDWLMCVGANPCTTWLNSNETIRNLASARAAELNQVYVSIVANYTFKSFDMVYIPFPLEDLVKEWEAQGGKLIDLIEPIDGFHPSQRLNSLLGEYVFNYLEQNHPSFIGPVNPNNDLIEKYFGDQGGY